MPLEKTGQLHASWQAVIGDEFNKPYMQALRAFLSQEKAAGKVIYPLPHHHIKVDALSSKQKTP